MINKQGVYTTKCHECTRSILIHVLYDGSISPNKCSKCEAEFEGIDNGEQRNTFVIVPAVKKLKIFVDEEANKTGKKPFEAFPLTKKSSKKIENSFKWR